MKLLLENWREFLKEEKRTINTKEELIDLIRQDPKQEIYLDNPKGTTKKFGGVNPRVLPFDYGEYPQLINPADGMGGDFLLTLSSLTGALAQIIMVGSTIHVPLRTGGPKVIEASVAATSNFCGVCVGPIKSSGNRYFIHDRLHTTQAL